MLREWAWRGRERVGRLRWRLGLMPVPSHTLAFEVAYNRFGGYCIPSTAKHRPAAQRVFAGLVWEESTIEYIMAHCGDGDVITAGTFFGDFLPALSRGIAHGATLWAFEPNPESYRCAAMTGLINDLRNVNLMHAALGEKRGEGELIIADFEGKALGGVSQMRGAIGNERARGEHAVPVTVVAIDDVVPDTSLVSVLQLDVEGAESAALTGAMATIRRGRPRLVLETLPEEGSWLAKELDTLGYRIDCKLGSENTAFRAG